MNTISMSDAVNWAKTADDGEYLCDYGVVYETDDERAKDDGSRCGLDDEQLAVIRNLLRKRDMCMKADDVGLVARNDFDAPEDLEGTYR